MHYKRKKVVAKQFWDSASKVASTIPVLAHNKKHSHCAIVLIHTIYTVATNTTSL